MAEWCGGEPGESVDVYSVEKRPQMIDAPDLEKAVKRLTGLDVGLEECVRLLSSLGIGLAEPADGPRRTFLSPSWRHDLAIEADLVEEIVRHKGLDNVIAELPPASGAGEYQPTEQRERMLRQMLTSQGFSEAISYSFIDTKFDDAIEFVPGIVERTDDPFVTLEDSIIEGAVRMRASALPGLLDAVRVNLNQQRRDQKLFEIGRVFAAADSEDGLPNERKVLAIVLTGGEVEGGRSANVRPFDFYDLKGMVEAAIEVTGIGDLQIVAADARHLKEGQSAAITIAGEHVGWMGTLSDALSSAYKFRQPVYAAELNLSAAMGTARTSVIYRPLAKYPAIQRDISFVVDRKTEFGSIKEAISKLGVELCRSVHFVDIYEGKGLEPDERSITIRLEYRSDERTLVEDEIEELNRTIVEAVENSVGAKVRFG
jgi:phenylalanyl-tRNA synthetase beta chain